MKFKVIYHSADFDGICCREIARKHYGDKAEYIGWNFGDPKLPVEPGVKYVIMDLSPDVLDVPDGGLLGMDILWIDHHKTAIEKYPTWIPGLRIDGVAACRLAWQCFFGNPTVPKEDYIDRTVSEPYALRLLGEHDVWDHRDPNAEALQYALRSVDPDWGKLLNDEDYLCKLLGGAEMVMEYARRQDESHAKRNTFMLEFEGLPFLAINTGRFNSTLFRSVDTPDSGHKALLGFRWTGKNWLVSMYHSEHHKDIDLSEIAKRHGGGGHRGACGFTCDSLPFTLKP